MAINIKYISGHRWNWQHKNTTHITSIIHSKINKISSLTTFYIKKKFINDRNQVNNREK